MAPPPLAADPSGMTVFHDPTEPITCLIADDHPAILRSIGAFLEDEGIEVTGLAVSGSEALRMLETRRPQVALVDQRLPDIKGIDVIRQAKRTSPETRILLYTGVADIALAREAMDAGGCGVVLKEAPLADVVRAVGVVASGATYLDPVLAGELASPSAAAPELTKREREVLRDLADGLTNAEIGAKLFLSPETIRTHVRKAMTRLDAKTRTQAVAKAVRGGMIS
jgi:DNA-binding NarL/FixJ family response regulator